MMLFGPRTEQIGVYIDQAHRYCEMARVIPLFEENHSVVARARGKRYSWPFNYYNRLLAYIALTVDSRKISILLLHQTPGRE